MELYAHKDHNNSDKSNFNEKILEKGETSGQKTLQIPELATVLTPRYSHSRMGSILSISLAKPISQIQSPLETFHDSLQKAITNTTRRDQLRTFESALPSQPQP